MFMTKTSFHISSFPKGFDAILTMVVDQFTNITSFLHLIRLCKKYSSFMHVFQMAFTIVRNILKCICKHCFSYVCKENIQSYVFFRFFTLTFLHCIEKYGIDHTSRVFPILECECMYGTYGSYYGIDILCHNLFKSFGNALGKVAQNFSQLHFTISST